MNIKAFHIDPATMLRLLTKGMTSRVIDGMPDDAQPMGIGHELSTNSLILYAAHKSFPKTPAGTHLPREVMRFEFQPELKR